MLYNHKYPSAFELFFHCSVVFTGSFNCNMDLPADHAPDPDNNAIPAPDPPDVHLQPPPTWRRKLTNWNKPPPLRRRTPVRHDVGRCEVQCPACDALRWISERVANSSIEDPVFSLCCGGGTIPRLWSLGKSELIEDLLTERSSLRTC